MKQNVDARNLIRTHNKTPPSLNLHDNQGHPQKIRARVLLVDERVGVQRLQDHGPQRLGAVLQSLLVVLRVPQQGGAPRCHLQSFATGAHDGGGNHRGEERQHGVLVQHSLAEEAGQVQELVVSVSSSQVAAQEVVGRGHRQLVFQYTADAGLRVQQFPPSEGAVVQHDEVFQREFFHLFILDGEQHARHAHQQQLLDADRAEAQEAVHQGDGQVQRLGCQQVLVVQLLKALNHHEAKLFVEHWLLSHVGSMNLEFHLNLADVGVVVIGVLGALQGVVQVSRVDVVRLSLHVGAYLDLPLRRNWNHFLLDGQCWGEVVFLLVFNFLGLLDRTRCSAAVGCSIIDTGMTDNIGDVH
mmetsp:Transcript_6251/g.10208  ORF Transcript_6251/g.10208 Transcript_6251/m.10208 type:complete len:355 (-) Transcript_6251:66-1130(-)